MLTIKANKTNLNKVIRWSSSSSNEFTKAQAIKRILDAIEKGADYKYHFATGAFSIRNCWGWGYDFEIKDGRATLTHDVTGEVIEMVK